MASPPDTTKPNLQPASRPGSILELEHVPRVPTFSLISWTFGRGSVIWRIWPAVALHTVFSATVVTLSMRKIVNLELPNIMLTVLGVVIGFVISYRASSGYERYWLGRSCWSDIMRNSRTLGRLIWYHVPVRVSAKTPDEIRAGQLLRSDKEMNKVMAEKRMALDLLHGFSVALKHHLRGEVGIYFEDLYHLVRPLHDHVHSADNDVARLEGFPTGYASPGQGRITTQTTLESSPQYGTFTDETTSLKHKTSFQSLRSAVSSIPQERQPLLPSTSTRQWGGPVQSSLHAKHRPAVAGGGENLPLEILRCLSEWFTVLEDRATVPGTSMAPMIGTLAAFEDNLTALERILTTPLPFVYSVHIRTVWLYLFFLPFQLVGNFGYYAIPGVAMAAFIYLGFVAAGEEMEQPFGYDHNDLDLDLFCEAIIGADIRNLKTSPALNVYLGPPQPRSTTLDEVTKTAAVEQEDEVLSNAVDEDIVG